MCRAPYLWAYCLIFVYQLWKRTLDPKWGKKSKNKIKIVFSLSRFNHSRAQFGSEFESVCCCCCWLVCWILLNVVFFCCCFVCFWFLFFFESKRIGRFASYILRITNDLYSHRLHTNDEHMELRLCDEKLRFNWISNSANPLLCIYHTKDKS